MDDILDHVLGIATTILGFVVHYIFAIPAAIWYCVLLYEKFYKRKK